MFGFGKKKINGEVAAKTFVAETHEWTNKTFESFQAQLTERLKDLDGIMFHIG